MSDDRSRRSPSISSSAGFSAWTSSILGLPAVHEAEDLVALAGEELREVAAVLAGDAGDRVRVSRRLPLDAGTKLPALVGRRSQSGSSWYRNSSHRRGLVGLADRLGRRCAGPRARAGSRGWSRASSGRSRCRATRTAAGGRGRGGSRRGSTRTPRRRRARAAPSCAHASRKRGQRAHTSDNRVAPALDGSGQRGAQRVDRVVGFGFEHGLGRYRQE